jgi:two-component system sensor histidine kinase TctE
MKKIKQRPSLRRLLLSWLLPAMALLIAAGAATAYTTALRHASRAYDRALFDTVLALNEQVKFSNGHFTVNLPEPAQQILTTDKYDQVYYEVLGPDGEFIAGNRNLPLPPSRLGSDEGKLYYDGHYDGKQVRIVALFTEQAGRPVQILAAETLAKRNSLVREILLGMLLPELILMLATAGLVWLGIRHGLTPLDSLRGELANRSHLDLRPVNANNVPEEIRPLADEINRLLARLEQSLTAQRHFVSDAAHQLRTPLAALQAQAELAMRALSSGSADIDDARQTLGAILTASGRLTHLAHQLLALARAEPGGPSALQRLDLAETIHACAEIWLPDALRHGIDLGFELQPAPVLGSALHLQEMVSNLIDNAIRYTPAPGTITVHCGSDAASNSAWLQVEDSGPGIPPEDRQRVFERFHRLADSPGDGCGLGLAIVREIARQHGGSVEIREASGLGGTLVEVRLPLAS